MRFHQRFPNRATELRHLGVYSEPKSIENNAPGKREPIRMQARRRNTDEHVTYENVTTADQPLAVNNTDDEAGEIVFTVDVKPRHFRSLTAEQRAVIVTAR
jgi:hypothetical protein